MKRNNPLKKELIQFSQTNLLEKLNRFENTMCQKSCKTYLELFQKRHRNFSTHSTRLYQKHFVFCLTIDLKLQSGNLQLSICTLLYSQQKQLEQKPKISIFIGKNKNKNNINNLNFGAEGILRQNFTTNLASVFLILQHRKFCNRKKRVNQRDQGSKFCMGQFYSLPNPSLTTTLLQYSYQLKQKITKNLQHTQKQNTKNNTPTNKNYVNWFPAF
eukprot:TRINITY_DN95550_c0_g1_i1.p1 TRINITY_DN95550_c0_g1~~TRINITY_DN95550_c0_g1_i1.p1  ORF type:complete len:215 (+),score=8.10 TRINITY_DN95550_c0_g1_i1:343-987(+)